MSYDDLLIAFVFAGKSGETIRKEGNTLLITFIKQVSFKVQCCGNHIGISNISVCFNVIIQSITRLCLQKMLSYCKDFQ